MLWIEAESKSSAHKVFSQSPAKVIQSIGKCKNLPCSIKFLIANSGPIRGWNILLSNSKGFFSVKYLVKMCFIEESETALKVVSFK